MNEYSLSIKELEQVKQELMAANKSLLYVSETDEMTGISNRRHIMNFLNRLMVSDEIHTISLIMMDIDYFKKINDTYGHSVGDVVIKEVSAVLSENIKDIGNIGRIGGEEFLIVLPNVVLEDAYHQAEKLRQSVELLTWKHSDMRVTISGGVYCEHESESLDELLEKVDERLYASKNNGRNQIA